MKVFQFRVLYRVFLLRVVDLELLSANGDTTKLLGQLAALLAGISFLFCMPLLISGGGWNERDLWIMEHLFIKTSMLTVGLFSVLSWESIFPDKRDVLVLAPLPVATPTIFIAKLAALAYALGAAIVSLNVFTGLAWPLLFSSGFAASAIRSYIAYWITMFAASAFMFFSVLTLQGIASQMLPRQLYLRVSALLQVSTFCLFLCVFFVEPTSVTESVLLNPRIQWLPTFWFFGFFQQLNGSSASIKPIFAALASRALMALIVSVLGATTAWLLSYLRTMRKIVEAPDIVPESRVVKCPNFPAHSLSGAITQFCLRTLLRSRHHRVILSFYFGVGLAVVLAYVNIFSIVEGPLRGRLSSLAAAPFLAASVLMMCVAIGGIRIVSSMPIVLQANWIFRITEFHAPSVYLASARRAFCLLGMVPVWLGSSVCFFVFWPWRLALEHLLVLGIFGMILIEACLFGFQRIPFTCAYLPGKGNLQYVFWACAFLLLPLVSAGAKVEMQVFNHPLGYGAIIMILSMTLAVARWHTKEVFRPVARMQFDEVDPPEIISLSLN